MNNIYLYVAMFAIICLMITIPFICYDLCKERTSHPKILQERIKAIFEEYNEQIYAHFDINAPKNCISRKDWVAMGKPIEKWKPLDEFIKKGIKDKEADKLFEDRNSRISTRDMNPYRNQGYADQSNDGAIKPKSNYSMNITTTNYDGTVTDLMEKYPYLKLDGAENFSFKDPRDPNNFPFHSFDEDKLYKETAYLINQRKELLISAEKYSKISILFSKAAIVIGIISIAINVVRYYA